MIKAVRAHNDLLKTIKNESKARDTYRQRHRFLNDPYKFTKNLFDPEKSKRPSFGKETADEYFPKTYNDPNRSHVYNAHPKLPRPKRPTHQFNSAFPDFSEFSAMVHKKSNKAAPGINGNTYVIYKN